MDASGPALQQQLAALQRVGAEDGASHFGAAGADEAAQPDALAAADVEADLLKRAGAGEAAHLEHDLAGGRRLLGDALLQLATDHHPDDLVPVHRADRARGDVASIAE